MPIGPNKYMDNDESCGLNVVTSVKLLGMDIDCNLENLRDNFDSTVKKMEKVANYWGRLKLCLPGRIAIAKTFLLSLVNHIGCILMPSDTQLDSMQQIFDNFCVGTLNIGIDRRYSSPSIGGLGLVRNRDFLISQHTIWLRHAKKSSRDNWRVDLHYAGMGDPLTVHPDCLDKYSHPVLYDLSVSFVCFNKIFTEMHRNFETAFFSITRPLKEASKTTV